jgi:Kef-type K+ transport system membrane component KefB
MPISTSEAEVHLDLLALALLLIAAHVVGYVFQRWRMPKVAGEIVGGLLLGPTILGRAAPALSAALFSGHHAAVTGIYWLGLLLLMFCSGLELHPSYTARDGKIVGALVAGTTIVPFAFGWLSTDWLGLESAMGPAHNAVALKLVVAVAIAITSIPVISKIFFDIGIMGTRFAKIVLATAAIHDVILWIFVAIATAMVHSQTSWIGSTIRAASGFAFIALTLAAPAIGHRAGVRAVRPPRGYEGAAALSLLLALAVVASLLGVNLVLGALLAGVLLARADEPRLQAVKESVKTFAFALPIPVYFALIGARMDLASDLDLPLFARFLIVACAVQGTASIVTTRLLRYNWLSSLNLAVALNSRGGPCIVLATVAYELGIINERFFVSLILLAILTSILAGAWLFQVVSRNKPLLVEP